MTQTSDATRRMRQHAHKQAFQHVLAALVHAVAAENHRLAKTLITVANEQSQLWLMTEIMTARVAAHLQLHRGDTLLGIHFWTEGEFWTFEDTTDVEGPTSTVRTAAARLVCVIANADPRNHQSFIEDWQAIWDASKDPETVALVAAGMLGQTYPNLRVPTA